MKHHPYANLFPMQSDEEIQSLADDIAKHGLRQPIVIDADEMILDGRNRSAACVIAQVKPIYEPFVGSDAQKLAYVVSVNVHRRHLTTAQRAEIAATIATMKTGENQHTAKKKKEGGSNELPSKPVTTEQAAKLMNVSVASVKRAKAKASPDKPVATVKPVAEKPANVATKDSRALEALRQADRTLQHLIGYETEFGKDLRWLPSAMKTTSGVDRVVAIVTRLQEISAVAKQLSDALNQHTSQSST